MLRLHDTASGRVEQLDLRTDRPVGLYVCGPTVYGPPHLGHGRMMLAFDVLRRWLEHRGYTVRHVENVTDIDDKVIDRANREGRDFSEVAAEGEAQWWAAAEAMGALAPTEAPRATEWIAAIVELVADLIERKAAYQTSDGVYLDTTTVPDYGLLKHQDLESLRAGARVALSEEKRSDFDFVLWKAAKPGEPSWPSPFGPGRPGWHSECVAMSLGLLGEGFDLHGGGADLIFPHHENERAQAVALGRRFAAHWVHAGLATVDGEKMAKSLGNFTTLAELFEQVDPRAFRLLVLRAHYRAPLEVSDELLADAARAVERIDQLATRRGRLLAAGEVAAPNGASAALLEAVEAAMDDDLGSPAAVGALFSALRAANGGLDGGEDVAGALGLAAAVLEGFSWLGLSPKAAEEPLDEATRRRVEARDAARAARDFATADRLRAELEGLGWTVEDTAEGTKLRR